MQAVCSLCSCRGVKGFRYPGFAICLRLPSNCRYSVPEPRVNPELGQDDWRAVDGDQYMNGTPCPCPQSAAPPQSFDCQLLSSRRIVGLSHIKQQRNQVEHDPFTVRVSLDGELESHYSTAAEAVARSGKLYLAFRADYDCPGCRLPVCQSATILLPAPRLAFCATLFIEPQRWN